MAKKTIITKALYSTKKAHRIWCAFPWSDRKRYNLKPIYPRFGGFVLAKRDYEFVEEMKGKIGFLKVNYDE